MARSAGHVRDLVFERMPDAVLVVDEEGTIVARNPAGAAWLDHARQEGAATASTAERYPALAPLLQGPVPADASGPDVVVGERIFASTVYGLENQDAAAHGRVILLRDETRRIEAEALLRTLATIDPLTRLPNQRHFLDLARRAVAQATRSRTQLAWLVFDVDDFEDVNQRYGPDTSDLILQSVAAIASASVRAEDALGRIGGDEFGLCLGDTGAAGARVVAERLRNLVANLRVAVGDDYAQVTVSIGVHIADGAAGLPDIDAALERAREAQARARAEGGDRFEFHRAAASG